MNKNLIVGEGNHISWHMNESRTIVVMDNQ